jgi:predicted Rossmann fold flavoprotein
MVDYDVVVIGAGAAGMMCAAQAGQRGRRVLLIEHYHLLGEKIRISGGGRCNFTNTGTSPGNFLSQNPAFCRSALARYTPRHFISLVEKYRIAYHEKKLGQLFCDDTAQDIIRMLKSECDLGQVQWRMPCPVDGVVRGTDGFEIATAQGPERVAGISHSSDSGDGVVTVWYWAGQPRTGGGQQKTLGTLLVERTTPVGVKVTTP